MFADAKPGVFQTKVYPSRVLVTISTVPSESRSPADGDHSTQPVVNFGKFANVACTPPAVYACMAEESPPSTISANPSPVMSTNRGALRKLRPWNLAGKPGTTAPVSAFQARSLLRIG